MGGGIFGTLHPFLEGGAVYGRKVANTGFMEALLRIDPFDEYHFFVTARMRYVRPLPRATICPARRAVP